MKTILICLILLMAVGAYAQPQQSANFQITKSVLDAGGAPSTSTNFRLVSAFGQPTPIGVSSSANFVLSAGFLTASFAVSPLSPIQDLVIQRGAGPSSDMQLNWSAITGATLYTVYRDTSSVFTPGPANFLGTTATNSFTDVGAVSLPAIKYFYIVTSTSGAGPALVRAPQNSSIANPAGKAARRSVEPARRDSRQISPRR